MFFIKNNRPTNAHEVKELAFEIEKCIPAINCSAFREWCQDSPYNFSYESLNYIYQVVNMTSEEWQDYFCEVNERISELEIKDELDFLFIMFYLERALTARTLIEDNINAPVISSYIDYLIDEYNKKTTK